MDPTEALQLDQLVLAYAILQDESFKGVKHDLSLALRLPMNSEVELYQLNVSQFQRARRRIINAVRHNMVALLVKAHINICDKFEYCRKRDLPLAVLVAQLAKVLKVIVPSAAVEASAFAVLIKVLDSMCGCHVPV